MTPDPERKRREEFTEEEVGARIFPYDHESIIYIDEEDDGGKGDEIEKCPELPPRPSAMEIWRQGGA